ncbi:FecR family protein [Ruegeria arenilitoris]|uniref:FecR family protein n=1 Tax=Ruegeria arenilitoris TaxID=1173585 RepID=UPI00147D7487|nr:FecR domain-containing protein [Ruegeria arenilitoris]
MDVASGDSISTDRSGVVQLVFVDETKIAIGPNARMMLDVKMLRGNRKAKNFAVQALGGSFRFISGKSKKRAYSIQTPNATMAVRGTTFDLWVVPGTQSAMLVLQGRVEMCGRGGKCREAGRQCSLLATTQAGSVGRPADQESYDNALKKGFPFVQSQEQLLVPLQIELRGCGTDTVPPQPQRSEARETSPDRGDKSRDEPSRAERSGVESAAASSRENVGRGNGGNIGSSTGSGRGNGGNIGPSSGSGNGRGGSIGGGSGSGGPGSGGSIGGTETGGSGAPSGGDTSGNGGNSGN